MADVIQFQRRPASVQELLANAAHLTEAEQFDALHRHIARAMGEADDVSKARTWVDEALLHLKQASTGHSAGGVAVSVSALHLALGYIEHLEERLGIIAQARGAV